VIAGHCRVSVLDPERHAEILDFGPGDVWYFPRGHGHSIQGIGSDPCHFILVFDNGYFSEFGTFSITDWLGHTPPEILSKNLGVPSDTFSAIPKGEVYFAKGPVPGPLPSDPPPSSVTDGPLTHRYRLAAHKPVEFAGGSFKLVSVKDFPISTTMCGATMVLEPGALRELHWHPNAAEWQYYVSGRARMTVFGAHGRTRTDEFAVGDVGYVPQGYGHYIESIGNQDCEILLAFNNGNYEDISLSDWLASNQPLLLETHFGIPESVIAKFPKRSVFITSKKS
jgi:oxalate decarboxylase